MIDIEFVESLIRALDESSLDSLELERGGTRIRLSKSPTAPSFREGVAPPPSAGSYSHGLSPDPGVGGVAPAKEAQAQAPQGDRGEAPDGNLIEVTSPMVGTFYRAPSPDALPYVDLGARVSKGSVLCIIEAMKLMNEMESEVEGTVVRILVENAEPVEYGQVLFLVDPS
jgi:acetyl-CoA carboxylase biotin carboxyl carrier protein